MNKREGENFDKQDGFIEIQLNNAKQRRGMYILRNKKSMYKEVLYG